MPTKILAIDDSKTMRLAIKITFAAEDAEVTSVSKGSEALPRVKQMGADIVLVDATLAQGEPSGYDVCRSLKGDPETARIPVIVMASSQTGVDQAKLRAVGADGYVLKPFETQELIDKVAEALGKAASKPAAAATAAAAAPAPAAAAPRPATISPTSPAPRPSPAPSSPSPAVVASTKPAEPARAPAVPSPPTPAVRLAPAAVAPAHPPAPAPRPVTMPPVAAAQASPVSAPVSAQPSATAASARADAPIPIAIPIPFVSADAPTPGILERLKAGGGPAAGLDPKVAAALVALSREVIEQIVWEVVPDLAEEILQKNARARTG